MRICGKGLSDKYSLNSIVEYFVNIRLSIILYKKKRVRFTNSSMNKVIRGFINVYTLKGSPHTVDVSAIFV